MVCEQICLATLNTSLYFEPQHIRVFFHLFVCLILVYISNSEDFMLFWNQTTDLKNRQASFCRMWSDSLFGLRTYWSEERVQNTASCVQILMFMSRPPICKSDYLRPFENSSMKDSQPWNWNTTDYWSAWFFYCYLQDSLPLCVTLFCYIFHHTTAWALGQGFLCPTVQHYGRIFCFNKSTAASHSTVMSILEWDQLTGRMPFPELTCGLHLSPQHLVD